MVLSLRLNTRCLADKFLLRSEGLSDIGLFKFYQNLLVYGRYNLNTWGKRNKSQQRVKKELNFIIMETGLMDSGARVFQSHRFCDPEDGTLRFSEHFRGTNLNRVGRSICSNTELDVFTPLLFPFSQPKNQSCNSEQYNCHIVLSASSTAARDREEALRRPAAAVSRIRGRDLAPRRLPVIVGARQLLKLFPPVRSRC